MKETFQVNYDDQPDDSAFSAIYTANKLLEEYGLKLNLTDDGKPHDGWMVFIVTLEKL